jgi:chloride channel protein, CIC family
MGGGMGALLADLLPQASSGFWALLAMCATMGGTMRSPLTATFFAVELTGNTHVLLPLITACATAHLVTVLLLRRSILTEKVARRGHHLAREYRVDPFTVMRAQEVMATQVETLPDSMTLHQVARHLTNPETRHPAFRWSTCQVTCWVSSIRLRCSPGAEQAGIARQSWPLCWRIGGCPWLTPTSTWRHSSIG